MASSSSAAAKVRLKWVKNRGLDHIIERDTDLKAACLLKDHLARRAPDPVPARALAPLQKPLGLTVPILRFLRRYPSLFLELPHPSYPSLPTFSLSPAAALLHRRELAAHAAAAPAAASRLARLLLLSRSRSLPLSALLPLRWDLGLTPDFLLPPSPSPSLLSSSSLSLASPQPPPLPALARSAFAFPMAFPRGYGARTRVRAWMDRFHRLPYLSPYHDFSSLDPLSELMEKRAVAVLHELLSLTLHKKTKRNYLRPLREELGLPDKFTRLFTRYPGVFYLSLKRKTTTVVLREGYQKGKLVRPDPLTLLRDDFFHAMRTGLLYRGRAHAHLPLLSDDDQDDDDDGDQDDDDDGHQCEEEGSE
ncbi:ubiquitin carboxyl-terminal hydrolase family protein [Wolffia australiana]